MKKVSDDHIDQVLARSPSPTMAGEGTVIARRAPNFALADQMGGTVTFSDMYALTAVILVFYPSDFTLVCTKQLCNYRDHIIDFYDLGLTIVGVSSNTVERHAEFAEAYQFPFKILSDPGNHVARTYGCTSIWMLGRVSRAVFIVSTAGVILYRYVEPTIATRRSASELLEVIKDLRKSKLL